MVFQLTPRVVTSCRGRFHIFDQARELARHNVLHQLITDYPKAWPVLFGVPPDKVRSLLLLGFINHGIGRVRCYLPGNYQIGMDRWVHERFSRQLARIIQQTHASTIFGLSGTGRF